MLRLGHKQKDIALSIGVHKSTISRELKRNVNKRGRHANEYISKRAQDKSFIREKEKVKRKSLSKKVLKYIRKKLIEEKWSPEYISERGRLELGAFPSHETIYRYIWQCKQSHKRECQEDKKLHEHLRHHGRRRKRKNINGNRGCIPNRTPMDKRSKIANERKRYGDIEVDLMMGKNHKPALIVMTDRKYRTTRLIKITTKNALMIANKIIKKMKSEKHNIYTLTFDNGLEFAKHEKIAKALGVKTYFTRPYTSQDKGTVENRIGVIRRFIPKGTDTSNIHHNTIKSIENKLNNRPMKLFNYLTPNEMKNNIKKVALVY
jgi:IS30 family transposase